MYRVVIVIVSHHYPSLTAVGDSVESGPTRMGRLRQGEVQGKFNGFEKQTREGDWLPGVMPVDKS